MESLFRPWFLSILRFLSLFQPKISSENETLINGLRPLELETNNAGVLYTPVLSSDPV